MKRTLLWLGAVLGCSGVAAEENVAPLWELGVGVFGLSLPAYRGAESRENYLVPVPWFQYRGERLRWDRDGGRVRLIGGYRSRLDLSLAASPPSETDDDSARRGMPDLDPTVEVGAQLELLLHQRRDRRAHWLLSLPVRKVVALESEGLQSAGWLFAPYLQYEHRGRWKTTVSAGPMFASESYHDYFYEVDPAFVTPVRPRYDADGGYSGSRLTFGMSRRMGDYWVGAFARYDYLGGATFQDSPLVEKDYSVMVGAGFAWVFARSKHPGAPAPEPW